MRVAVPVAPIDSSVGTPVRVVNATRKDQNSVYDLIKMIDIKSDEKTNRKICSVEQFIFV